LLGQYGVLGRVHVETAHMRSRNMKEVSWVLRIGSYKQYAQGKNQIYCLSLFLSFSLSFFLSLFPSAFRYAKCRWKDPTGGLVAFLDFGYAQRSLPLIVMDPPPKVLFRRGIK
jgi:hypothetical protein